MKQTANLRQVPPPIAFGDDASRLAHERKVERARQAQARAGIRYAIAPLQAVRTPRGKLLGAGTPVRVSDFEGHETRKALAIFHELLHCGIVLEADVDGDGDGGPAAA